MSLGRLISWVLFFGLRPRWFVFCLVFGLFSAFSDETQVWLGDLRVVVCWWFCLCCRCGLICLLIWTNCVLCTNSFHCLCSCKDRASVRHRPNSRKKKSLVGVRLGLLNFLDSCLRGLIVLVACIQVAVCFGQMSLTPIWVGGLVPGGYIHVASRRQPPAPHRWAHTAGA